MHAAQVIVDNNTINMREQFVDIKMFAILCAVSEKCAEEVLASATAADSYASSDKKQIQILRFK
ncbi:MAG: hypothetical protein ACR2PW_01340 [Gammaproteobacteria bacterium]